MTMRGLHDTPYWRNAGTSSGIPGVGKEEIYLTGEPGARKEAEKALVSACDEVLANGNLIVDGQSRGTLPGLTAIEPDVAILKFAPRMVDLCFVRVCICRQDIRYPSKVCWNSRKPFRCWLGLSCGPVRN